MIYGKNLRLRAIERSDLSHFQEWLNDEEVTAGLMIALPLSLEEEAGWFEAMLKTPAAEHPLVIEVKQDEGWMPIGDCSFNHIDERCRVGEIGILIGEKAYWNRGHGTEVMRMLLRHGFNTLNLNRIFLNVYATNLGAIRCYERAGFIHEGRLRQAMYKHGSYVDVLVMSVLRSEWFERNEQPGTGLKEE